MPITGSQIIPISSQLILLKFSDHEFMSNFFSIPFILIVTIHNNYLEVDCLSCCYFMLYKSVWQYLYISKLWKGVTDIEM